MGNELNAYFPPPSSAPRGLWGLNKNKTIIEINVYESLLSSVGDCLKIVYAETYMAF